ncbi:MAG: D-glycero-beta-D-manno-heptose-7-phosphate kinase [Oligoflexia bacterium]|nr:D-glycero-beta-D-manno-heptose-7-phosphate kinase [Oligoflexia bacterium]
MIISKINEENNSNNNIDEISSNKTIDIGSQTIPLSERRFKEIIDNFSLISPILVFGDVGLDKYTFGNVSRISPEAPVAVLEVSKEWYKLGLAANVIDNLRSLKVPSTLLSVIGDDKNGFEFEKLLRELGLDSTNVLKVKERVTTLKERVITNTQQICRIDYENKNELSTATYDQIVDLVRNASSEHSALIIEDYGKGIVEEKSLNSIINIFRESGKLITVDPSRSTNPYCYKNAHLLKPNFEEASIMVKALGFTREKNLEMMANILVDKLNLDMLVITLGANGMGLIDKKRDGKFQLIPTVAKEVFDVSGAGDTAISVITSSLVAKATLEESCWIANCASGIVVAKRGTATVSIDELSKFYRELEYEISQRFQ